MAFFLDGNHHKPKTLKTKPTELFLRFRSQSYRRRQPPSEAMAAAAAAAAAPDAGAAGAPSEPTASTKPFDVVAEYKVLLKSDPEMTMPVAAIEALVSGISTKSTSTFAETLEFLEAQIKLLVDSVANSISLSAGTDLFKRYLITSTQDGGYEDFEVIRAHLIANGRIFVQRAKAARDKIAKFGIHLVGDNKVVLTAGGSRVVGALLREAAIASAGSIRFKVIYVLSSSMPETHGDCEGMDIVNNLRHHGVPVATVSEGAVAYALDQADMVLVGAEGVVENGGVISRLGTCQLGMLAKAVGKPLYIVAESHKFVRLFPLNVHDLPIRQRIVDYRVEKGKRLDLSSDSEDANASSLQDQSKTKKKPATTLGNAVDFTPPELISAIITESGALTPSAVSEELIKIWY
jgi:translation initiation factor eIF-2B subunit alpha